MKHRSQHLKPILTVMAITFVAVFFIIAFQATARAAQPMVDAGNNHTVGLKTDGTVVAVGFSGGGKLDVGSWTDIVQVAAGAYHTVGLKSDGTVVAVGADNYGQLNVGSWTDIVQVDTFFIHTVGLKSDGTVVAVGANFNGELNVGSWTNIVQVDAGGGTLGLKSDGTVVAVGANYHGQLNNVGSWTDIVQVAAGRYHNAALKSDGTVVAVGADNYGQLNVGSWTNIVQVEAGNEHTMGLKSDGTVVAVGSNGAGQLNVGSWTDIVQVDAGWNHTVGLKSDGTVVAVGDNFEGQGNTGGWNLFTNTPAVLLSKDARIAEFVKESLTSSIGTTVGAALACSWATPAASATCATISEIISVAQMIHGGYQLYLINNDPPDPDFTTIFLPLDYPPPTIEASEDLPPELEGLANITFRKFTDLYELTEAWRITLERYNGAEAAGDTEAAEAQLKALEGYIIASSAAADSAKASLSQLLDALEPLFGLVQITQSDVLLWQSEFAQNGFDTQTQELFSNFGLSQEEINIIGNNLLAVNPSDFPSDFFFTLQQLTGNYVELVEVTSVLAEDISIDIKPGSDPNSINPKSKGVIPVAILTTDTFDASTVDPSTVRFGPTGTEAAPEHFALEDINGDLKTDIILHFFTQDTEIQRGDIFFSLIGKTYNGQAIKGSGSIRTVGNP